MISKVLCLALLVCALVQAAPHINTKDSIPESQSLIVDAAEASGAGQDPSEDFSRDTIPTSTESVVESTTHLMDATELTPTSTEELTKSTTSSEGLHEVLRDEWSAYIYLLRSLKKKVARAEITHSDADIILANHAATPTSMKKVTESKTEDRHEGLQNEWPAYVYLVRSLKKKIAKGEITFANTEATTDAITEATPKAITEATTEAITEATTETTTETTAATKLTPTSTEEVTETNNFSENLVHSIVRRATIPETTPAITETTTLAITETTTPVITETTTPAITETTTPVSTETTTPAITETTTPAITETTTLAVTETTTLAVTETTPAITETTTLAVTETTPAVTETTTPAVTESTFTTMKTLHENQRNEWSVIMDLSHKSSMNYY